MKYIVKIVLFSALVTVVVALNASAFWEIQDDYEELVASYYNDGLESDFYALYDTGTQWWFLDDAEVRSVMTNQTGYKDRMSGHTYAEIKNGYDGNFSSNIEFGFDHVRTCETSASINDEYATRTHHNCELNYDNIYRYSGPYTVGVN